MARWRPTPHFDPSELERGIDRATLRRAWSFARPYRGLLGLQLAGLAGTAVMGILPPLVLKALVDRAVAGRLTTGGVNGLVVAAVAIALTMTGLGLLNRWLGSRIGEGLIYDQRVALFRHVQRMPLAFFTYTQTGSLLSRLSNDVLGAQQAVGTLSTVVSDLFTLVTTLTAMLLLSWKVTLLALLVVPGFVALDRRMAKRLATLSRQRMAFNADMSSTLAERIDVEDVWFRYPSPATVSIESLEGDGVRDRRDQPSEPVLRGVSFSAEPGTMVALVGPSGAGKTTLSSLIPRLYDVTSGAVRIDGRDVRDLTLESVGRAVGVVSQDPHLFHDTVGANLRYARPDATDAEIVG